MDNKKNILLSKSNILWITSLVVVFAVAIGIFVSSVMEYHILRDSRENVDKEADKVQAEIDKEAISRKGHIETYYGTRIVELPQSLNRADEFMIADDMLYVIPDGTKIVKLLFEGAVDIIEVADPATRMDMQFEYMFMRRIQLGVCKAEVYGIYKING